MRRALYLLAAIASLSNCPWPARPAAAGDKPDDRPGGWTITTTNRLLDPTHRLLEMSPKAAQSLRDAVAPPSTQNYCVVGGQKLINANYATSILGVDCRAGTIRKNGRGYSMSYSCGGRGKQNVNGRIDVIYDSDEHYTGRDVYASQDMTVVKFESDFEGRWVGETCPGP